MLVSNKIFTNDVDKFISSKLGDNIIIYLYIHDMLILGTSLEIIYENKRSLGSSFDMKDLGKENWSKGSRLKYLMDLNFWRTLHWENTKEVWTLNYKFVSTLFDPIS